MVRSSISVTEQREYVGNATAGSACALSVNLG